jgi:hypothetical protein
LKRWTDQAVFGKHYSDIVRAAQQNESRGADGPTQGAQIAEILILGIDSSKRNCIFPDPGDLIGG